VFSRPRTLFVAMFIGSPQINRFDCDLSWDGDTAILDSGELVFELSGEAARPLRKATETKLAVCVRPQRLSWAETEPEDRLSIPVTVNVTEKIGTEDIVRCTTPRGHDVTAEVNSGTLSEGMDGYLIFDPANIHLFDGIDEEAERLN
jgi:multiple sugar transport system ATP-binding protein